MEDFFAQPPWNIDKALLNLKRSVRELKLVERGDRYEWDAKTVLVLRVEGQAIHAQLAQRPALQPQYNAFVLSAAPDVRKLLDEIKKRLARWSDE